MNRKLPRTVIILGLVSLFNDLASEIVVPLIPILLTTVLGAGPVALGLVEGVADALASWLKLWSGRHSDALGGRRKELTLAGYALSNLARPLLGLAGSWGMVLLLRSVDRAGKGLRSAPRDALVADATPPEIRGYAYGYHRALDNAGAVGGSLAAAALLTWTEIGLAQMILLSAIPGAIAVLFFAFGVAESKAPRAPAPKPPLHWGILSKSLRRYLLVLALFTLGRASETFILLFGHQLGMSIVSLLLLWAALNLAKAATSTLGGRLADRFGRGALILLGWGAFGVSFLLLSRVGDAAGLWSVALAYGLLIGMAESAERAIVSDYARADERGAAFGWYHLATGIAAIPAGLLFGGLWQAYDAPAAFQFAGALALLCVVLLRFWAWPYTIKQEARS